MHGTKQKDLQTFFQRYENEKEIIFEEIYRLLGRKTFTSKKDFINSCDNLLLKEKNNTKKLSSGLLLQLNVSLTRLILTDENHTFKILIEYIKKIKVKKEGEKLNKDKYMFIISNEYYNYIINKKYKVKYKSRNCSKESSLGSNDLELKIIFNKNLEYLVLFPDYTDNYQEIFKIYSEETNEIEPNKFYNKYRLLNFPEMKEYNLNEIKWKRTAFDKIKEKYKYFCYNKSIGLSVYLQRNLIDERQYTKYFYFDINYLFNEKSNEHIQKYIFYCLSTLYNIDDKQKYIKFIEDNIFKILNNKIENIIESLLNLIKANFTDCKLYIDNIKTKAQFDIIDKFIKNNIIDIFVFIQINENTLDFLCDVDFQFITDFKGKNYKFSDDLEIHLPYCYNKINLDKLQKNYSDGLSPFFKNLDYKNYCFLLKIKSFLNENNIGLNELKNYSSILNYFYINIDHRKIIKINFRNDIIKEIFDDLYEDYIIKITNNRNDIICQISSKSNEGINFERQIIYDTIISNIGITKIKIDKIFCAQKFPDFDMKKNQKLLFIQTNSNSPYFDFAIIYTKSEFTYLKVDQIGINKSKKDLTKLNKSFLLFDLYFFCEKLFYEKKIKIDFIEICIITTYNAYEENLNINLKKSERKYDNFLLMKNYSKINKFLFLIYDIKNSQFFRFDKKDKLVKTDLEFSEYNNKVLKIFNNNIGVVKKLCYYFKLKNPKIIGKIKSNKLFTTEQLCQNFDFKMNKKTIIFYDNSNIIEDTFDKKDDDDDDYKDETDEDDEEEEDEEEINIEKTDDDESYEIPEIIHEEEEVENDDEIKETHLNIKRKSSNHFDTGNKNKKKKDN